MNAMVCKCALVMMNQFIVQSLSLADADVDAKHLGRLPFHPVDSGDPPAMNHSYIQYMHGISTSGLLLNNTKNYQPEASRTPSLIILSIRFKDA